MFLSGQRLVSSRLVTLKDNPHRKFVRSVKGLERFGEGDHDKGDDDPAEGSSDCDGASRKGVHLLSSFFWSLLGGQGAGSSL